jgi:hypothetical protein
MLLSFVNERADAGHLSSEERRFLNTLGLVFKLFEPVSKRFDVTFAVAKRVIKLPPGKRMYFRPQEAGAGEYVIKIATPEEIRAMATPADPACWWVWDEERDEWVSVGDDDQY